jgi:hypothetical protein
MSFASSKSGAGNQVVGASGRKAPVGIAITRAFTTIGGMGNANDIAFDPAFGYMIVGGDRQAPMTPGISLVMTNPQGTSGGWTDRGNTANVPLGINTSGIHSAISRGNGRYILVGDGAVGHSGIYKMLNFTGAAVESTTGINGLTFGPLLYMNGTNWITGESNIWTSSDDGDNWTQVLLGNDGGFSGTVNDLARSGTTRADFNRGTGYYRFSTDNGATWTYWTSGGGKPGSGQATLALASNGSTIVGVGNTTGGGQALILRTTDGGVTTFSPVANPRNIALRTVVALPSGKFLAAGDNRGDGKPYVVLGSSDGATWIDKDVSNIVFGNVITRVNRMRYLNGRVWLVGPASPTTIGFVGSTNEYQ